jgi:hypothetical protein
MTRSAMEWTPLHDATLVSVAMEWTSGEARVTVRLSEERRRTAEILVFGFTLVHCARRQPWGPSVSINEVRRQRREDGWHRIEIELQSGDVLELEGNRIELWLVEGSAP